MKIIPLQPVPSQRVKTVLDDQIIEIDIRQLRYGMFINIYVNTVLMIGAVICQNRNRIVRDKYLKEKSKLFGDFVFNDTNGNDDPVYTGLGDRFQLLYLSADDLVTLGVE